MGRKRALCLWKQKMSIFARGWGEAHMIIAFARARCAKKERSKERGDFS